MKKFLLLAVLATISLGAFAQGSSKRGPVLTNKFKDNWFLSVGGGINVYVGENDIRNLKVAPALDVSLGKWFTPAIGARLQYAGLKAKGHSPYATAFTAGEANSKNLFAKQFNVNFIHADFLWNISNQFGGYKERRWQLIPFAGVGAAMASKGKAKKNEIAFTAGLLNQFRLGRSLALNLEFRGMLVNERFDLAVGHKKGEGMGSVTIGLTYKFKKRGFDKPVTVAPADYTPYNNRISTLESELSKTKATLDRTAKDLAAAKHTPAPAAKTEVVLPEMAIFFPLNKATINEKQLVNLNLYADVIKKLPADRKIKLVGNADSVTGNAKINQKLSEQRAKAVYDALVARGVPASRLEIVARGDKQEPFEHNKPAMNRVLLIE